MGSETIRRCGAAVVLLLALGVFTAVMHRSRQEQYRAPVRGIAEWRRSAEGSSDVREQCQAVVQIGRSNDPAAAATLVSLLDSPHLPVVTVAARELGRRKATIAVEPLIRVLEQPDPNVKFATIKALQDIGDGRAAQALRHQVRDENPFAADAAWALGRLKDAATGVIPSAAEEMLIELLESPHPRIRQGAVLGLRDGGTERALPALQKLLADPFHGFDPELLKTPVMEGELPSPEILAAPCRDAIEAIQKRSGVKP
jgi:HEAT repeat protein